MNELSKLQAALARLDLELALSADCVQLSPQCDGTWPDSFLSMQSPRLALMKSDCLKYIAAAKVNQMIENRNP